MPDGAQGSRGGATKSALIANAGVHLPAGTAWEGILHDLQIPKAPPAGDMEEEAIAGRGLSSLLLPGGAGFPPPHISSPLIVEVEVPVPLMSPTSAAGATTLPAEFTAAVR